MLVAVVVWLVGRAGGTKLLVVVLLLLLVEEEDNEEVDSRGTLEYVFVDVVTVEWTVTVTIEV